MSFKSKSADEQVADREQLARLQRIDREGYFYKLLRVNKLGITDLDMLNDAERAISGQRNYELGNNFVPGKFDFEHLKAVHRHLFGDIYYFAGELRTVDMEIDSVTRFWSARRIEQEGQRIFGQLAKDNHLKGLAKPDFIAKLADFMTDLNILHPFRDGNGRSKRAFTVELAKQAGYAIDFSAASKQEWLLADETAFDSSSDNSQERNTDFLRMLLDRAISPLPQAVAATTVAEGKDSSVFIETAQTRCFPFKSGAYEDDGHVLIKVPGQTPNKMQLLRLPAHEVRVQSDGSGVFIVAASPELIKKMPILCAQTKKTVQQK